MIKINNNIKEQFLFKIAGFVMLEDIKGIESFTRAFTLLLEIKELNLTKQEKKRIIELSNNAFELMQFNRLIESIDKKNISLRDIPEIINKNDELVRKFLASLKKAQPLMLRIIEETDLSSSLIQSRHFNAYNKNQKDDRERI